MASMNNEQRKRAQKIIEEKTRSLLIGISEASKSAKRHALAGVQESMGVPKMRKVCDKARERLEALNADLTKAIEESEDRAENLIQKIDTVALAAKAKFEDLRHGATKEIWLADLPTNVLSLIDQVPSLEDFLGTNGNIKILKPGKTKMQALTAGGYRDYNPHPSFEVEDRPVGRRSRY